MKRWQQKNIKKWNKRFVKHWMLKEWISFDVLNDRKSFYRSIKRWKICIRTESPANHRREALENRVEPQLRIAFHVCRRPTDMTARVLLLFVQRHKHYKSPWFTVCATQLMPVLGSNKFKFGRKGRESSERNYNITNSWKYWNILFLL